MPKYSWEPWLVAARFAWGGLIGLAAGTIILVTVAAIFGGC